MPRWAWITLGVIAVLYVVNDPVGSAAFVNTILNNLTLFASHMSK